MTSSSGSSTKSSIQKRRDKFACIAHPTDLPLFRSYMRFLKPEKTFRDELLLKLFEWTPAYKIREFIDVTLDGANFSDGVFVNVPFLPEMRDIKLKEVTNKIEQAVAIAAQAGCAVAALGGFTSIVLQGQEERIAERHRIKLTSGNTLTAAIIVRSITELCARFEIDLATRTMAIIGASGDIGSGCAQYFCDKVKKLVLTARGTQLLDKLKSALEPVASCAIETTTDNVYGIQNAAIVICVTSAYGTLFSQADFKAGTIVCDASAPQNVQVDTTLRNDIFLYHGGVAKVPVDLNPGFDIGLAANDTFYGCQLEGIMIALNPSLPCSWGRGNITREKVGLYLRAMDENPRLGTAFTLRDKGYTEEETENFRRRLPEYCSL
jgi:fatty aldehyde-generating acyl-ACP reductase